LIAFRAEVIVDNRHIEALGGFVCCKGKRAGLRNVIIRVGGRAVNGRVVNVSRAVCGACACDGDGGVPGVFVDGNVGLRELENRRVECDGKASPRRSEMRGLLVLSKVKERLPVVVLSIGSTVAVYFGSVLPDERTMNQPTEFCTSAAVIVWTVPPSGDCAVLLFVRVVLKS
jgi:hypothetical protein